MVGDTDEGQLMFLGTQQSPRLAGVGGKERGAFVFWNTG